MRRVRDVSVFAGLPTYIANATQRWWYLTHGFARDYFKRCFVYSEGSWDQLNIPHLGGPAAFTVLWTLALSYYARIVRRRWFGVHLAGLIVLLTALTVALLLLTDFSDHRFFTLIMTVIFAGLAFLFHAPTLAKGPKTFVILSAVAIAVINFIDLGALHGKVYGTQDYAPKSQRTYSDLVTSLRDMTESRIRRSKVFVVRNRHFFEMLLFTPYLNDEFGVTVLDLDPDEFCKDKDHAVEDVLRRNCGAVSVVYNSAFCRDPNGSSVDTRTVFEVFPDACTQAQESWERRTPVFLPEVGV
jgi:hypothetical protein